MHASHNLKVTKTKIAESLKLIGSMSLSHTSFVIPYTNIVFLCDAVGWRLDRGVRRRPDICHRERGRPHGPVDAASASARALQALSGQHGPAFQAVLGTVCCLKERGHATE